MCNFLVTLALQVMRITGSSNKSGGNRGEGRSGPPHFLELIEQVILRRDDLNRSNFLSALSASRHHPSKKVASKAKLSALTLYGTGEYFYLLLFLDYLDKFSSKLLNQWKVPKIGLFWHPPNLFEACKSCPWPYMPKKTASSSFFQKMYQKGFNDRPSFLRRTQKFDTIS